MKLLTAKELASMTFLNTCDELQDNKFAVISERLYDLTDYRGCADGRSYHVITVYDADGCFNMSCAHESIMTAENIICAFFFYDGEEEASRRFFVNLIAEGM